MVLAFCLVCSSQGCQHQQNSKMGGRAETTEQLLEFIRPVQLTSEAIVLSDRERNENEVQVRVQLGTGYCEESQRTMHEAYSRNVLRMERSQPLELQVYRTVYFQLYEFGLQCL